MTEPIVSDSATFSITEAAKVLGVHRNTIQNWIRQSRLPVHYRKVNNKPFITGRELKRAYAGTF